MLILNIGTIKLFVGNKNVVGFQIDNELGAEDPYCYCEVCRKKFAKWLQDKYGTVEKLNNVWGLTFWSERQIGRAHV